MDRWRQKRRAVVIKFGGTSLATPKRVRRAAQRVRAMHRRGRNVIVVVSAMGHTTDRIISVLEKTAPNVGAAGARELDRALATGEDLAAAVLASALVASAVPAVSLRGGEAGLRAGGAYGRGELQLLQPEPLQGLLSARIVPIVSGYQAVRPDGQTVTLGRGGSDTSAVFIAGSLGACCDIVTDVDGVFDEDPRLCPGASLYSRLSYAELIQLVDRGAQVVHPAAARYARDFAVPLRVYSFRSSFEPTAGTAIGVSSITPLEETV